MADSLVGIHPHPGPTRKGVRSRGEGRRRRNEARRESRRRGQEVWAVGVGSGGGHVGVDGVAVGCDLECEEVEYEGDEQEEAEKCGGEGEAGGMGDGVANWAEGRWGESGLVGGRRGKGGADPREEGGSDVKGRSARKVGRRGAAKVVWGEGGSSGGWKIEIGVGIPAKLGADGECMERCRRDMERQVTIGNRERIVIGGGFQC